MRLGYPHALWLSALLPLLVGLLLYGMRRRRAFLQSLGELHLLQHTPFRYPGLHRPWVRVLLLSLTCLGLVIALADPRMPYGPRRLAAGVVDTVVLIDVSKSMLAEDYQRQSRLDKARELAKALLADLRGNRVGFVTFAGNSFRQAELTEDFRALEFILQHWVREDSSGVGGSNLAAALDMAIEVFPKEATRKKLLILLSDGGDTDQPLDPVLTKATHHGINIVALGVGTLEPVRIPQYDANRQFTGYLQIDGQVITTRLNEAPLQRIADATHGQYWRATRAKIPPSFLAQTSLLSQLTTRDEQRIFQPFLLVGLLGCAAQVFLVRL